MEAATLAQVACVAGPKLTSRPGPIGSKLMLGLGSKLISTKLLMFVLYYSLNYSVRRDSSDQLESIATINNS